MVEKRKAPGHALPGASHLPTGLLGTRRLRGCPAGFMRREIYGSRWESQPVKCRSGAVGGAVFVCRGKRVNNGLGQVFPNRDRLILLQQPEGACREEGSSSADHQPQRGPTPIPMPTPGP
jgi:hypothetical protein